MFHNHLASLLNLIIFTVSLLLISWLGSLHLNLIITLSCSLLSCVRDNYYLMSLNRSRLIGSATDPLVLWGCRVLPSSMVIFWQIIFCHRYPIVSNNWSDSSFHLRVFKDFYLRSRGEKVAAQKQRVSGKRLGWGRGRILTPLSWCPAPHMAGSVFLILLTQPFMLGVVIRFR